MLLSFENQIHISTQFGYRLNVCWAKSKGLYFHKKFLHFNGGAVEVHKEKEYSVQWKDSTASGEIYPHRVQL